MIHNHRVHTVWHQPLSDVNFFIMEKLAQAGEVECKSTPFHYIDHHVQSCNVRSSWEPEQFLLNPSGRPVLETSGGTTERGGWPLLPHTDVSATRLRGGLDTTLQVTSFTCHHSLSSLRSSWECSYAHSISSLVLYPYVLCVHNQDDLHWQPTICMICIIHTLDGVPVPIDPRVVCMVRNEEDRHGLKPWFAFSAWPAGLSFSCCRCC